MFDHNGKFTILFMFNMISIQNRSSTRECLISRPIFHGEIRSLVSHESPYDLTAHPHEFSHLASEEK